MSDGGCCEEIDAVCGGDGCCDAGKFCCGDNNACLFGKVSIKDLRLS